PAGVGVNPATNRVYVANFGSDTVSVIDGATSAVIATVPVGPSPNGVAVNPGANRIYATNVGGNSVPVIDGTTNTVVATIPVSGAAPFFAAANPRNHRVYVSFLGAETGGVDVINGVTNRVLATIPDAQGTRGVAVDAANNRVFFVNQSNSTESVVA